MPQRVRGAIRVAMVMLPGLCAAIPAYAQNATLRPLPAAECQDFAGKIQQATGIAAKASEEDFSDVIDGADGRSCHIMGGAAGLAFGDAGELMGRVATVFAGWRDDPARAAPGGDAAEKGFVNGTRIATVQVSWEPGPGVTCSDKEALSTCKVTPQQKLWTVVVDVVEKAGK
jgi:hypothetical protein